MTPDTTAYLLALLHTEAGSLPRAIAERVWTLLIASPDDDANRSDILEYLTSVMTTNPCDSRAFEIADDLLLLMGVRGVAA